MTASFGGTAKIYAFPKGGRAGLSVGRFEPDREKLAPRPVKVVSDAWYHEEAIQQAARARKN